MLKYLKLYFINIFVFLFCLFAVEVLSRVLLTKLDNATCLMCRSHFRHPTLGSFHKPNSEINPVKKCSQEDFCYNVKYEFDSLGRRKNNFFRPNKSPVLLFGCSYTFGEGLNEQDTIGYLIQEKADLNVFNYAKSAASAALALSILEDPSMHRDLSYSQKGLAIYFYLDFQLERASLSTHFFTPTNNYFKYVDHYQVELINAKDLSRKAIISLYSFYDFLKKHSRFLQHFNLKVSENNDDENEKLFFATILAVKKRFESKFNGRFILIVHPSSKRLSQNQIGFLKKYQVKFYEIPALNEEYDSFRVCKCDPHPNRKLNEYLAIQLIPIINKELSEIP